MNSESLEIDGAVGLLRCAGALPCVDIAAARLNSTDACGAGLPTAIQAKARLALRLSLILILPMLSGCLSSLLPKAQDRAQYALPAPAELKTKRALPGALLVDAPSALAPLDGRDVLLKRDDGELQIMPGVAWIGPLPSLMQDLLARQIEMAGSAPAVAQSAQNYRLPLRLSSELRAFELHENGGSLKVHTQISLRLICTRNNTLLAASEPITVDAAPVPDNAVAATAALREAASLLARQVVFWLATVDATSCTE